MEEKTRTPSSEEPTPNVQPEVSTEAVDAAVVESLDTPVAAPVITSAPTPVAPVAPAPVIQTAEEPMSLARKINRAMAFVLIFSGVSFVLITILSIWEVFGPDAGETVWRSLGSLGAIALGALIVSVAAKIIEDNHHK